MIVVRVYGGLGNQMFQYAVGRVLSIIRRTELKLDVSWYSGNTGNATVREYALEQCRIQAARASSRELDRFLRPERPLAKRLRRLVRGQPLVYREKKRYVFDPRVLALGRHAYIDGYWQNERYFEGASATIRQDFALISGLHPSASPVAESIRDAGERSVSIHVRGGDYVTNPVVKELFGTCDSAYYLRATNRVAQRVDRPVFFIFTDDQDYARTILQGAVDCASVRFVAGPWTPHVDMHLMSLCRSNIIANSTFSWWAAWLNRSPGKLVVAPARWVSDGNEDTSDALPGGWVKL